MLDASLVIPYYIIPPHPALVYTSETFCKWFIVSTFVVELLIGPLQIVNSQTRWYKIHHVFVIFEVDITESLDVFCGRPQHVCTPHLLVWKVQANDIPCNMFWKIPALLEDSALIHYIHHKCNDPICNTKTTVQHKKFEHRKERLVHTNHEYNSYSKLHVLLWAKMYRSVLSLENLWLTKNLANPTADYISLISKRMWFVPNIHKSSGNIIVPLHLYLVMNIDPRWVELIRHVFVLCLLHMTHMY